MRYVKSLEWVRDHIDNAGVRIVDCRFQLNNPTAGERAYELSHIPNAVYLNLDTDLSSPVTEHGGRHPLPNLDEFAEKLSTFGIDENVTVIAYDDQNGAMASRLWWLLHYIGHEQVFVMSGSFHMWVERGFPIDTKVPSFDKRNFKLHIQSHLLASTDEVRERLNDKTTTLIDSREEIRYKGIAEPIDKIAGHIPGAVNYFWQDGIESDGKWKDQNAQAHRFRHVPKDQQVIVYCGSGVTACPNVLSLKEAGYKDVKLYLGSWSDWISYPENPIAKSKPLS
jgi:thiosulfate/3-mercaptopyruvate sulfurtransferase